MSLEGLRQWAIAKRSSNEPARCEPKEREDGADDADQDQQDRHLVHAQPQRHRRKQLDIATAQHVQREDRQKYEQRQPHRQEMVERGLNAAPHEELERE